MPSAGSHATAATATANPSFVNKDSRWPINKQNGFSYIFPPQVRRRKITTREKISTLFLHAHADLYTNRYILYTHNSICSRPFTRSLGKKRSRTSFTLVCFPRRRPFFGPRLFHSPRRNTLQHFYSVILYKIHPYTCIVYMSVRASVIYGPYSTDKSLFTNGIENHTFTCLFVQHLREV